MFRTFRPFTSIFVRFWSFSDVFGRFRTLRSNVLSVVSIAKVHNFSDGRPRNFRTDGKILDGREKSDDEILNKNVFVGEKSSTTFFCTNIFWTDGQTEKFGSGGLNSDENVSHKQISTKHFSTNNFRTKTNWTENSWACDH